MGKNGLETFTHFIQDTPGKWQFERVCFYPNGLDQCGKETIAIQFEIVVGLDGSYVFRFEKNHVEFGYISISGLGRYWFGLELLDLNNEGELIISDTYIVG